MSFEPQVGRASSTVDHAINVGAAFFDLDHTIVPCSSEEAFIKFLYQKNVLDKKQLFWVMLAFVRAKLGIIKDHDKAKKDIVKLVVSGLEKSQLHYLFRQYFESTLKHRIHAEVKAEIHQHKQAGRKVIIISAALDFVVEAFADYLQVDTFFGQAMEVADGIFTGNQTGESYFGDSKAVVIKAVCQEQGLNREDSIAYSDSYLDIPMLESVGTAVAVNPDRKLHRVATAQGWKIVNW